MNARGVTRGQLEQAAREVGVELYNLRAGGKTERAGWSFTLRPAGMPSTGPRYVRRAARSPFTGELGKRLAAVCWHGHRDFFRALYRLAPGAKIRTSMAVYNGAQHFEEVYRDSDREIGNRMRPTWASEACNCQNKGAA